LRRSYQNSFLPLFLFAFVHFLLSLCEVIFGVSSFENLYGLDPDLVRNGLFQIGRWPPHPAARLRSPLRKSFPEFLARMALFFLLLRFELN
jgi:hypothetical protein